ncbi:uncharacterized protein M421DRAFT_339288 [Didymella exigua CBS 183.55]|uniref:Uncharacterized protein n=1 Tax=Didymella exigua CBS 183.55 TaxID=1150837 RepID=A0A6A5RU47_9PLEO|nr:uncharacterized protein M421DRAFT_339288 [Didymella exigua CBS 183.55]KAF1931079.1 hypothetical protein M421DRAFT_339288 [Didymella exigua CBS 183.55]
MPHAVHAKPTITRCFENRDRVLRRRGYSDARHPEQQFESRRDGSSRALVSFVEMHSAGPSDDPRPHVSSSEVLCAVLKRGRDGQRISTRQQDRGVLSCQQRRRRDELRASPGFGVFRCPDRNARSQRISTLDYRKKRITPHRTQARTLNAAICTSTSTSRMQCRRSTKPLGSLRRVLIVVARFAHCAGSEILRLAEAGITIGARLMSWPRCEGKYATSAVTVWAGQATDIQVTGSDTS